MLFPHILEYFSISREEIDLLKNEVINDAVQTWINNMRILRKSLNLFVCVCTGFLVCVERERERERVKGCNNEIENKDMR